MAETATGAAWQGHLSAFPGRGAPRMTRPAGTAASVRQGGTVAESVLWPLLAVWHYLVALE